MIKFRLLYIITLLTTLSLADDFKWDNISKLDWDTKYDSSASIKDAVMLFERIVSTDDLYNQECYFEMYRRIRIISSQGRKWGDVVVPYFKGFQKLIMIKGRTIFPDSTTIELKDSHVYEKDVLKTEEKNIKQISFYLPGISDDCIIEYYYKIESKYPIHLWEIQKEIFLNEAEYTWDFYKGQGLSKSIIELNIDRITPNYMWVNERIPLMVRQIPNLKSPRKIVFTAKNVPIFESESMTLPDLVFKMNARFYYGDNVSAESYWGDESTKRLKKLSKFSKDDDKLNDIIKVFKSIESENEKIKAAYQWIQANIKNVNYEDNKDDFKENYDLDDVIKRRYGTSDDINKTFVDMLVLMNIDAKLAWVVDRDKGLLEPKAKYWQFDRSLVAVEHGRNKYSFYRPASKYLPFGYLDWYHEGVDAFIIGSFNTQFANTPFSSSAMNKTLHSAKFKLDSALNASGFMYENYTGHPARYVRGELHETTQRNLNHVLKKRASKLTPSCIADSFEVTNLDEYEKPLQLEYKIQVPQIGYRDRKKTVIQPFRFIQSHDYGFYSEERMFPILFSYAREYTEAFSIELPDNWEIESLPADSAYINSAGSIYVIFKVLQNGKALSMQRLFILKSPFFRASQYEEVKALMDTYIRFSNIPIILKQTS